MRSTKSFTIAVILAIAAIFALGTACGPAYVATQQPYVEVQPVYEPGLSVVYVGGQRGYYDPYHHFVPVVLFGGYEGYYDSYHRFHSSAPAVQQAVQTRRPLYSGPSTVSTGSPSTSRFTQTQQRTTSNPLGLNGSMGRPSTVTSPQAAAPAGRPTYGGGSVATQSPSTRFSDSKYTQARTSSGSTAVSAGSSGGMRFGSTSASRTTSSTPSGSSFGRRR